MLRNHSYLPHRYSVRSALFLMTLDTRVHAGGGARGQNVGHLNFFFFFFFFFFKNDIFFFFFFFFKNDILISFQSRTEDLTHNVRAYVLDWVYTSALYTALK